MRQKEFTQKTVLSKDELNRIYKYRNNKQIKSNTSVYSWQV